MKKLSYITIIMLLAFAVSAPVFADVGVIPASLHDWTGPYAGTAIGAGVENGNVTDMDDFFDGSSLKFNQGFAQWGIHAGFNQQMQNAAVLGIEGEINGSNQDWQGFIAGTPADTVESKINWSAALLGRAGLSLGNSLFFLDAGPALAHFNGEVYCGDCDPPNPYWHEDTWIPGVKFGGGVETMIAPKVSFRVQYSVLDLVDKTAYEQPSGGHRISFSNEQQAVTAGVDWHF